MNKLTHLSLFSGIGGMDLAAENAGFETVGQCEWAEYPTKVLQHHWPYVHRWGDIKTLTKEDFYERTRLQEVTVISGGFPCQDLSLAGRGKGLVDEQGETTRSGLWFEMLRVINEIKPGWVIVENVAGILFHREGDTFEIILGGLEASGYETVTVLSPACNYGAAFEGKRVFIIATSNSIGYGRRSSEKCRTFTRLLVTERQQGKEAWGEAERRLVHSIWRQETAPECLRGDYGFPDWVDRIACIGNAVVPQQVYPLFKAIARIEK